MNIDKINAIIDVLTKKVVLKSSFENKGAAFGVISSTISLEDKETYEMLNSLQAIPVIVKSRQDLLKSKRVTASLFKNISPVNIIPDDLRINIFSGMFAGNTLRSLYTKKVKDIEKIGQIIINNFIDVVEDKFAEIEEGISSESASAVCYLETPRKLEYNWYKEKYALVEEQGKLELTVQEAQQIIIKVCEKIMEQSRLFSEENKLA